METPINRTLIIRLSSIGDVVLASPLIRLLREHFPSQQIDFLVKSAYADLLRYNPHLSSVIELDPSAGANHLRNLRGKLKRARYDVIIDLQGNFRSFYLRWNNARRVLVVNKRRVARFFLINFKWNIYASAPPVALRYLETVRPLGIVDDGLGLELSVPTEIRNEVSRRLNEAGVEQNGGLVGICPGANHATKQWPWEKFAELASHLIREENLKVALFGGKGDEGLCGLIVERVLRETNRDAIMNFAGSTSLLETAAAMDSCDAVVANDTGLLHLAVARKRRVVGIYGPTVKEFGFFPDGMGNKVLERSGLYCRPCSHLGGARCPEGHFRCMKEISVHEVLNAVKSILAVPA
jgi:lipopolysaccharide heptosyltransferase II